MKVLHLLSTGNIGGIEVLCKEIAQISKWDNEFCFLFSGGIIADEIEKLGNKVYYFSRFNRLKKWRELLKICNKEKYQVIIQHHEGISIQLYDIFLSVFLKEPIFIRGFHSSFDTTYFSKGKFIKNYINKKVLGLNIKTSDKLFAVSEYVAKSYKEKFKFATISCIYNGISDGLINKGFANVNSAEEDLIQLVYIGRIAEIKGVHLLIKAIAAILEQHPNVRLRIVGEGAYSSQCKDLVNKYLLEQYVTFEGMQRNIDFYLKTSNLFVYPSICQEAFGISVVEAMAYGLICIATPVGGIPEIIEDERNGFLTEGITEEDVKNGIIRAISYWNDINDKKMINEAKLTAKRFSLTETIKGLEGLLHIS